MATDDKQQVISLPIMYVLGVNMTDRLRDALVSTSSSPLKLISNDIAYMYMYML